MREPSEESLDPKDWDEFRRFAAQVLEDMICYQQEVRERPVWRPLPEDTKAFLRTPVPREPAPVGKVYAGFRDEVLPYPTGNIHPRFWSWVSGTGSPLSMLASLMSSAMNSISLGFDEAASSHTELQVINWFKSVFGFPTDASGLLVSGGSMGNLVGLAVARTTMAGYDVRAEGVDTSAHPRLMVYASSETHSSVQKAVELLGLGDRSYARIPVKADYTIDLKALEKRIREDRDAGHKPICVVANAGTVNTGAVDDIKGLADLCEREHLWLHVDGAFGAAAQLAPSVSALVAGMERADSLTFDLHKWFYQPYNAGCVLVRSASRHRSTFSVVPSYIRNLTGGVAAGPINFSEYGVQLSRSFSALPIWFSLRTEGLDKFRRLIEQNVQQARYLTQLVETTPELELLAPTQLNIVNFRHRGPGLGAKDKDSLNERILIALQERGIAAPSSTILKDRFSIRVCIVNHRTRREDLEALVAAALAIGVEFAGTPRAAAAH